MAAKKFNLLKLGVAAVVAPYCFWYATVPGWHFIDGFDLMVHEAGHPVFSLLGQFMGVLGGSLMQCLFPLVFLGYFLRRRDYFSASIMGYWVGINLINVSIYAGDARKMELQLLNFDPDPDSGGPVHDWNWLLTELHWLKYTPLVAHIIYTMGVVFLAFSLFFSVMFARQDADDDVPKAGDGEESAELKAMMKGGGAQTPAK